MTFPITCVIVIIMRVNKEDISLSKNLSLVADGWISKGVRLVCWKLDDYKYELEVTGWTLTDPSKTKTTIPYNASYEDTIAHVKEMCSETGACCVY